MTIATFWFLVACRSFHRQDLTLNCAKSWYFALDIIKDKKFWTLAAKHGAEFVTNLKAFRAMRAGFASGNFAYGLFVARLPETAAIDVGTAWRS